MPKVTGKKTKHESNGSVTAKSAKPSIPPKEPLWRGPSIDGVTFSLLSKFISCRERFRLLVVEGLKEKEGFSVRLEYGNMVHTCEEATAAKKDWEPALLAYARKLVKEHGNSESATIDHWYKVCRAQYPIYLKHWKKNPDVVNRKPIAQEKPFDIEYKLPSGRTVRLRGKYDSIDLINKRIYVQENKARGEIKPDRMLAELPLDLQTGIYGIAAEIDYKDVAPLGGIRYNVLRRPLSGGKYSIKQHEGRGKEKKGAETEEQFFERLQGLIAADPTFFFYRWMIELLPGDTQGFKTRILNPWLEQLWDWWTWIECDPFNPWRARTLGEILDNSPSLTDSSFATSSPRGELQPNCYHWVYPSGVYNPKAEGKSSTYDEYILTGSDRGLTKTHNLFPELEQLNA